MQLLYPNTKYVLCWNHTVGDCTWQEFLAPLVNPEQPLNLVSRVVHLDFILETKVFTDLLPEMGPAIKAVQLTQILPDYLDMEKVKGKQTVSCSSRMRVACAFGCTWQRLWPTYEPQEGSVRTCHRNRSGKQPLSKRRRTPCYSRAAK